MQTIEQLELALEICKHKKPWQSRKRVYPNYSSPSSLGDGKWLDWVEPISDFKISFLCNCVNDPNTEIRLAPKKFPKLPEGEKWYNPKKLTPDDIPEGARLFTASEMRPLLMSLEDENKEILFGAALGPLCNIVSTLKVEKTWDFVTEKWVDSP